MMMLRWRWGWFVHLGGVGLILLGVVDQSFVPIPGGMDILLVILAAGHGNFWAYYWVMATAGAVLGGFLTYRLSMKGGKETLRRKLPLKRIEKVEQAFAKHGFLAIFVAALLPPPLPMVPIIVGAGALQYPTRKFFLALTSGRVIRYGIVIWLAHIYGRHIIRTVRAHTVAITVVFLVFSAGAALGGYLYNRYEKRKEAAAILAGELSDEMGRQPQHIA
jgi:membrane protein DedA with SNARE-associated domain